MNSPLRPPPSPTSKVTRRGHGSVGASKPIPFSPPSASPTPTGETSAANASNLEFLKKVSNYASVSSKVWSPSSSPARHNGTQQQALSAANWLYDELDAAQCNAELTATQQKRRRAGLPQTFLHQHQDLNADQSGDDMSTAEQESRAQVMRMLRKSLSMTSYTDEMGSEEADKIMQYLGTTNESVIVEAGSGRGKLVLNLALKSDHCRQVIALEPNLDQLVLASKIAAPLQHNHILACPLKFNCCEIAEYHYINATHVILQNAPSGSGGVMSDPTACRVLVEKLAASPVFKLLVTTSPLPIQASLVHLGEFLLGTCGPDKARMYCHLYSTSFENAPIGTIAQLYSKDGICVLPRANLLKSMSVSARSPTQVISTPPEVGVRQLSTPNDICGGQADGSVLPQSSQALPSQRSVMSLPPFASGLAGLLHWRGDEDMSMLQ